MISGYSTISVFIHFCRRFGPRITGRARGNTDGLWRDSRCDNRAFGFFCALALPKGQCPRAALILVSDLPYRCRTVCCFAFVFVTPDGGPLHSLCAADRIENQFDAGGNAQLIENMKQVVLDRMFAHIEFMGDFSILQAL